MIRVRVHRGAEGLTGLTVEGHAGYADKGQDIVCAGVSALAQTAVLGLRQVARIEPVVQQRDGYLAVRLPTDLSGRAAMQAETILSTTLAGLQDIARSYPDYVELET